MTLSSIANANNIANAQCEQVLSLLSFLSQPVLFPYLPYLQEMCSFSAFLNVSSTSFTEMKLSQFHHADKSHILLSSQMFRSRQLLILFYANNCYEITTPPEESCVFYFDLHAYFNKYWTILNDQLDKKLDKIWKIFSIQYRGHLFPPSVKGN